MRNDFLNPKSTGFVSDEIALKQRHRQTSEYSNYLTANITHAEKIAQTQKLLDNAIVSAWHTVKTNRRPPALTPIRWVWRLAGLYHLCHSTPQLMEEAGQRFTNTHRQNLAQWAVKKAREEAGHDQLALLDIQSMGYQPQAVVEVLFPPAAKALVEHFTHTVQAADPIECVGYSYTGERLAICRGVEYIQMVEALLPAHTNATRCLRLHSAVGSDVAHVEETIEMVAELTYEERIQVAKASYTAALLRFSPPQECYISDAEIQHLLKPLEHSNSHS